MSSSDVAGKTDSFIKEVRFTGNYRILHEYKSLHAFAHTWIIPSNIKTYSIMSIKTHTKLYLFPVDMVNDFCNKFSFLFFCGTVGAKRITILNTQ